jgi:hypothetical protein
MRIVGFALAVAVTACFALTGAAHAQSTKGAGKTSLTIIAFPVGNIQAKAAGAIASKPSASVAGKAPTGGGLTSLKLAKASSDPLKPGFGAGDYVLDIETGVTPDGDVAVHAFVTLSVDALGKCTVHVADTSGNAGAGQCGGMGQPLCAPEAAGKCSFTTYQAAGIPNYTLGPGDGQPTASRVLLRTNPDTANCHTGDILLGTIPAPGTSVCHSGTVVGVMGVANGDITP